MTEKTLNTNLLIKDFENRNLLSKFNLENKSLILFTISAIFYGFSNFHLKLMQIIHIQNYEVFSFGFWRSLTIALLAYMMISYKKIKIENPLEIKNKFWLIIRSTAPFFSVVSFIYSLRGLRAGTAGCIVAMNPLIVVLLATLILKEKFHSRYIIGILICLSGVVLILTNERGGSINKEKSENFFDILICVMWGLINLFLFAFSTVASKCLEIGQENQLFYIGTMNTLLSLIFIIFGTSQFVYEIYFILSCIMNAILFFIATLLLVVAVKGVDVNKTTPLNYISLVVSTLMAVWLINEPIFFTDVIGSLIILGYNISNALYPIKDKI